MANFLNNFISSIKSKAPSVFLSAVNPALGQAYNIGSNIVKNKKAQQPNMSIAPQQSAPMTNNFFPSNNSATNPTVTIPKPTGVTPPITNAGQRYIDGLAGSNVGGATTGGANPALTTGATSGGTASTTSDQKNAYLDYLRSVFNPAQLATAQKNIEALNQQTADELKRSQKRDEYLRNNEIGQLETGQNYQLSENDRLSSQRLGNIAAAKGASTDALNTLLGAGKSIYDIEQAQQQYADTRADKAKAENAPFELSEGQVRYQYDQKTGQYKAIANVPKTYAPKAGTGTGTGSSGAPLSYLAQAVQNGTVALSSLTPTQRGQVAAELARSGISSDRQNVLTANLGVVDELLANPAVNQISGIQSPAVLIPGTNAQLAKNQYNQLKGILSLENRQQLKGQGAISDFEFKVLSDAATALGRNLSDAQFKAQLQKVRDVFAGKYVNTMAGSGSAPVSSGASTAGGSGVTPSGISYTVSK